MEAGLSRLRRMLRGTAATMRGRGQNETVKEVTPLDWMCVTAIQVRFGVTVFM